MTYRPRQIVIVGAMDSRRTGRSALPSWAPSIGSNPYARFDRAREPSTVPANSLAPDPCLTREQLRGWGLSESALERSWAFDDFGCAIDMRSGTRRVPACWQRFYNRGGTECRWVRVDTSIAAPRDDFATFVSVLLKVADIFTAIVGVSFGDMLGMAMKTYFSGKSFLGDFMSQELKDFLDQIERDAKESFQRAAASLGSTIEQVKKDAEATFERLGASVKTLAEMMPWPAPFDAIRTTEVLGYIGIRENAVFAANLLAGGDSSIAMLQNMGVRTVRVVADYAGAKTARTMLESVSSLQSTVAILENSRGPLDAETMRHALANFPKVADQRLIPDSSIREAAELSSTFAGKPDALLDAVDPRKIEALLPARIASGFGLELARSVALERALRPAIKEADQLRQRELDRIAYRGREVASLRRSPDFVALRRAAERANRSTLGVIQTETNRIVRAALPAARAVASRVTVAVPGELFEW